MDENAHGTGSPVANPAPYDLHTFHEENRAILALTDSIRQDGATADALVDGTLSPATLDLLVADVARFATIFAHYCHKEELVLPHLERHNRRELSERMWEGDNRVRSFVGTTLTLVPGARKRPSAGNLQSVAGLLEDAAEHAASMVAEEESELLPLMAETLDDTDWNKIASDAPLVPEVSIENPASWGPNALDMAEARLRALSLNANK